MAETALLNWYRYGTVNAEQGSTKIYGANTRWTSAGINPGATFRFDNSSYDYEIGEIISDTELNLVKPYNGETGSGLTYSIDRNFQSTQNAQLAARIAKLAGEYELIRNGQVVTINGKSAYDIAQEHGFSGTEEEYLEMLKGGGEIVAIREDIEELERKIDEGSSIDEAEIINARLDNWENTHDTIGDNIRDGQARFSFNLQEAREYQEEQFSILSKQIADILEELRELRNSNNNG